VWRDQHAFRDGGNPEANRTGEQALNYKDLPAFLGAPNLKAGGNLPQKAAKSCQSGCAARSFAAATSALRAI
jgi:hypothetical protein